MSAVEARLCEAFIEYTHNRQGGSYVFYGSIQCKGCNLIAPADTVRDRFVEDAGKTFLEVNDKKRLEVCILRSKAVGNT